MGNDILCIGELLIDFICSDINVGLDEGVHFVKKAGGAPANVAVTISKLGGKALYAGKVGNDPFGKFLKQTLEENGVCTSMLVEDSYVNTTLAFVSLRSNGDRDFIFNRGADELHCYEELDHDKVSSCRIIHFGSATALLGGPSKETYLKLMKQASERGQFVSFDPNHRTDLWRDREAEFIEITTECIKLADFAKTSDDEIKLITGQDDLNMAVKALHNLGVRIIAVTLGKEGTLISNNSESKIIPSIKIKSIDSTGAGDAFVGAFLYQVGELAETNILLRDLGKLEEIVKFANKVGAIVCTKLGAMSSIPVMDEVEGFQM